MVELVVTDLDGTLWMADGVLPASTRLALGELAHRGIPVLAATARRSWSALHYFGQAGLDLPVILLNGALGRDSAGGTAFHRCPFDPVEARHLLAVFTRHGLVPCANFESDEWDVVSGMVPSCGPVYREWAGAQLRRIDDLDALVSVLPVYAFSIVAHADEAALRAVAADLAARRSVGSLNVFADRVFGGWTLDCAPSGVDKWRGVEAFCAWRDLDSTQVLAIGDGDNDVELLARASRSLAMSHASEGAKAAAQVTLTDGIDGWAGLLDYV